MQSAGSTVTMSLRAFVLPVALIILVLTSGTAQAASTNVVISQLQVQGAISGDPRGDAFVELHNLSDKPVSLKNWLLIYTAESSPGSATNMSPFDETSVIPPGGYYLLATPMYDGVVTKDGDMYPPMDPAGGTVWLAKFGFTPHDAVLDGHVPARSREPADAPAPAFAGQHNSLIRAPGVDTDVNTTDFSISTSSAPRNSSTTPVIVHFDADGDGIIDAPTGPDTCQGSTTPGPTDIDGDGEGNSCDTDDDGDTVLDVSDNCVLVANVFQRNADGDALGDDCDDDIDADGFGNASDNCDYVASSNQADLDGDGQGDPCDSDDDGDGRSDTGDNCPTVSNASQANSDGDGQGDACDTTNAPAQLGRRWGRRRR